MSAPRRQVVLACLLVGLLLFSSFLLYSWGWSERLLAPVRVGMSKSKVQSLVGEASRIRGDGGAETWDYTRAWSRDARVYFDTNGLVGAIETD